MVHYCRVCGSPECREVFSHDDTPLFIGIIGDETPADLVDIRLPVSLVVCENCSTVQQADNPKVEALLDQIYIASQDNACSGTRTGEGEFGLQRAQEFLQKTGLSRMPKRVLEVGCNEGHMLKFCEGMGAETLVGIEPSVEKEIQLGKSTTILPGYFDGSVFPKESFDLVYLISVFEHIPNVAAFLRDVRDVLAPGGRLALSVPNCETGLKYGNLGMPIHEHLLYFTPISLRSAIERAGFSIVREDATFANLYCVAEKSDNILKEKFMDSVDSDLFWPAVESRIRYTQQFIETHSDRWGFYGACSLTTNLLAWGPNIDLSKGCIVDADPNKWGRVVSGCKIPTLPPLDATAEGTREFLVMPFGFQESIRDHIVQHYPEMKPTMLFEGLALQYEFLRGSDA
ncbi:MAG: hypothetical protein CMP14_09985 [Rickettsiales bacterium]|nr:hypothetical protein [Rickettsiales bacterium]